MAKLVHNKAMKKSKAHSPAKSKRANPAKTKILKKASYSITTLSTIFITVAILGAIVWYVKSQVSVGPIFEVGQSSGVATLSLSPSNLTLTPNTETSLTLSISGGDKHLTGAQIELTYDASIVGTPTVTLTDYFPITLSGVKVESGKIKFTVGAATDSGGKTGDGNLATIKFTPVKTGSTNINFTDKTLITATEISNSNALRSADNATITVSAVEASPSPSASTVTSPSLSSSINASPSTSPLLSPSPSPSPSPSNNAEKLAKPTGLRSNCYNNGTRITLRWDEVTNATSYKLRLDQKDGSNDKSVDGITKTEYDFDLQANQNYSWWVHATKDGIDSEEAKIDTVKCEGSSSNSSTPTPTPKPTIKATATPKPTPRVSSTPKATSSSAPTSSATPSLFPIASSSSLSDIFTQPSASPKGNATTSKPGFFKMITLGWQAILEKLADMFK